LTIYIYNVVDVREAKQKIERNYNLTMYYILIHPILFMGLRLWIKTKKDPEFTLRTQWQYLNQSIEVDDEMWWFFQDEWEEDYTLYRVAGLTNKDPHGTLQKMYYKNHMGIIEKLVNVTSDDIDKFFTEQWERNVPYWDMYRTITISYLEAKRDYIKSLYDAGIVESRSAFDMEEYLDLDSLPCWYEYRYTGPAKVLPRIPGKVTVLNKH